MRATEPVLTIKRTRLRESEKAVQFNVQDISGEPLEKAKTEWFPYSQIKSSVISKDLNEDILVVSEWILNQKDLI